MIQTITVIIIGFYLYDTILDAWRENTKNNYNFHFLDSILKNYCNKIKDFFSQYDYKTKMIPFSLGLFLKDTAVLAGMEKKV